VSIVNNAMVLNLQIGIWKGYRLDREASAKVTKDAGADSDAARVNKHLVPKESLKEIERASTAIREHFYRKTLPWKDNGDRLLTRLMFRDFIEDHERLAGEFKDAVEQFLTKSYPEARERAAFRMGELFDLNDYPAPDSLRRRFYTNLDIDSVTDTGDFRVELEQAELDQVRASMEKAMGERLGRAMRDVWERLSEVVGHFAKKMGSEDIFRDATVRNIEELVDILPGLNVTNDPDLAAIGEEVKAKLAGYDPKDLRKKPEVRSQAALEAKEIMERMSGFMSAFGVSE
jgi:hypothetical protein